VTGAALPVRGGIVLDVCELNRLLGFDRESQIVEVEAGMFGDIFEQTIQQEYGMTMGHWPSSYAISTVGGWVAAAARASCPRATARSRTWSSAWTWCWPTAAWSPWAAIRARRSGRT
jgi:FAD/FMN-containing dehydrogenase